jgi:hypothetical protein
MSYTATIRLASGEQFTATGISYRADLGILEFTGASALTTRSNLGLYRIDSATAGAALLDDVSTITVT